MEFQGYIGFKGYKGILTKAPKPIKHQTMPTAGLIQISMLKFQGDRERKQRKKKLQIVKPDWLVIKISNSYEYLSKTIT